MKLRLTIMLLLAAFITQAQTIVCKDTTITKRDTVTRYEYDTIPIYKDVYVGNKYNYDTVCGKWCQAGIVKPRYKVVSIEAVYRKDTSYTYDSTPYTVINITKRDTSICQVVPDAQHKMYVGVKFQQANIREQVQQAKDLQTEAARPNSVAVTGNKPLDDGNAAEWKADGYKTWVNVAWYENPNAKPYPMGIQPSDMSTWASGFETLCKKLQGNADGVAIENERANGVYWIHDNDPNWVANYVQQIKIAIPIARKYGIKISDGSIPIEDVELIMDGAIKSARTKRVKALMDAYKTLDLDYVLFHGHYAEGRAPVKDLAKTINYLAAYTGHKVFSNELSMVGATANVIMWFLHGSYDAKCDYAMFWSGDGGVGNSKGDAITAQDELGKAIIKWQNTH